MARSRVTLLTLPDELLLQIMSFVRLSDVDNLLLTNHRVHNITTSSETCSKRRLARDQANAMFEMWTRERKESDHFQPQSKLNYLALSEDLSWLVTEDLSVRPETSLSPITNDSAYRSHLDLLAESALFSGLTIPPSFLRIVNSWTLQSYLLGLAPWAAPFDIEVIRGNLVQFQPRVAENRARRLFLHSSGAHCVLEEVPDGSGSHELLSTNFESFLVHEYYTSWLVQSSWQFLKTAHRTTARRWLTVDFSPMWLESLQEEYFDRVRPKLDLQVSASLQFSDSWMEARERRRVMQILPFAEPLTSRCGAASTALASSSTRSRKL